MDFFELFLISIAVSMDAFAVAICKGLSLKNINMKKIFIVGLYFGLFQTIMPLIGYSLSMHFQKEIAFIDGWIALILLGYIGIDMMVTSLRKSENPFDSSLAFKNMLLLAIATSVDALAVGVTWAFLQVDIVKGAILIGSITFILSMIGVKIGHMFGIKLKSKAEFIGGLILVFMGIKIFLEHTDILSSWF